MKKIKVVSSSAMAELEKSAISQGFRELDFMEHAGLSIAQIVEKFVQDSELSCEAILLVGKGNNGGDAYAAGTELLQKGFQVKAFHLYEIETCSPLCRHQLERFTKAGGSVQFLYREKEIFLGDKGVILDGLVGTGFQGAARDLLADVINVANQSHLPILAIDIPSGVSGNSGEVKTVAIQAAVTIYLELPKIGFFLKQGWDHTGFLVKGSFGLPSEYIDQVIPSAFLVEKEGFALSHLPKIKRAQNKYSAGYVLTVAGSYSMTGAGILSSYAALRSGAGIVRWFYPTEIGQLISSAPWEVIKEPFLSEKRFFEEMFRAKSLIIGPGMGREKQSLQKIQKILSKCSIPCVIDADALYFLSKDTSFKIPSDSVLTPHMGELHRLLEAHSLEALDFLSGCQDFVEKKETMLLVKGAPNFLFAPGKVPHILPFGNPGMATAGTGDVLAGVLGALFAQRIPVFEAVVLGCYLHGMAGDIAAGDKTCFCMTASDLLESLPEAFSSLLVQRGIE